MTIGLLDLGFYALAVGILFLTPGPVWVALLARAMSGGFKSAWPLALGVCAGDALWPLLAILGVSWLVNEFHGIMIGLRLIASLIFVLMGGILLFKSGQVLGENNYLTRRGAKAGFVAGLMVILGNPKAILFYIGVLPGFFDLKNVTNFDILAIVIVSITIPLCGNLILAGFVGKIMLFLSSSLVVKSINNVAGLLLIMVGSIILFV